VFTHTKPYKSNIMTNQTFILETKTKNGVRGEQIHKVVSPSLSEAIQKFAAIKDLKPDQLIELFSVYEQPTNGK